MNSMHLLEAMTNIDSAIIENAQPQQKPKGKVVTRLLLLAALIAALTMTAFAAREITNWFEAYFAKYSEEPLTQEQITFIDENTTDLTQSKTYGGYTLAVESAISDGNNGFIKLKFTAPEHVVLDAEGYFPGNDEYLTTEEKVMDGLTGTSLGCGLVEDDDDLDNTVSLMIYIRGCVRDRTKWRLYITSMKATYFENPGTDEFRQWDEVVAVGFWDFDITFSETGKEELQLITEPVPGRVNISLGDPVYEDVNITSLKLRAMSAEINYEYVEPQIINGEPRIPAGEFDPIYVVMKDGTEVWMVNEGGYPGGMTFQFLTPIVLEEVSHVLLPDGTKLPIPEL